MKKIKALLPITSVILLVSTVEAGDLEADNVLIYGEMVSTQDVTIGSISTNGLLLHYNCNIDEGGIVTDQSGNEYTGTVSGATYTGSGKVDGGYDYDGANDYIESPSLSLGSGSMAAWIKLDCYSGTMAVQGIQDSGVNNYWKLGVPSDGKLRLGYRVSSADRQWDSAKGLITTGVWHHVCTTLNTTTLTPTFYIDGLLVTNVLAAQSSTPSGNVTENFRIGNWKGQGSWLNGIADEVLIYNRILTSNEVYNLYLYSGTNYPTSSAKFYSGIGYSEPLGDISMGVYTNQP